MIWLLFSNWRLLAWLLNYKREELPGEAEFSPGLQLLSVFANLAYNPSWRILNNHEPSPRFR